MIRKLRRRLAEVRYHAARRPDTVWTRWRGRLLIAAIVLTLPAMLAGESTWHRDVDQYETIGGLVGPRSGPFVVGLATGEDESIDWPSGSQQATFEITRFNRLHGWPLTSRVTSDRLSIDVDRFNESRPGDGDPVSLAIIDAAGAMADSATSTGLASVANLGELDRIGVSRRSLAGTAAALGTWWLVLSALFLLALGVARLITELVRAIRFGTRRQAQRAGRCPNCGYDMRASVWSERCPECGALSE
ncbi:MAG: hypothetical protein AB8G96_08755 [Phycisphaerales bacterium]